MELIWALGPFLWCRVRAVRDDCGPLVVVGVADSVIGLEVDAAIEAVRATGSSIRIIDADDVQSDFDPTRMNRWAECGTVTFAEPCWAAVSPGPASRFPDPRLCDGGAELVVPD